MKHGTWLLFISTAVLMSCGTKQLTKEEAKTLISKERGYPKAYTFTVYRIDPVYVSRLEHSGLESAGLVTLKKSWSAMEEGQPKIFFTAAAKPYLMGPEPGKTSEQTEVVKVADMDISEITNVTSEGRRAVVNYTIGYRNLSPFRAVYNKNFDQPEKKTAYFILDDQGWHMESKAGAESLQSSLMPSGTAKVKMLVSLKRKVVILP